MKITQYFFAQQCMKNGVTYTHTVLMASIKDFCNFIIVSKIKYLSHAQSLFPWSRRRDTPNAVFFLAVCLNALRKNRSGYDKKKNIFINFVLLRIKRHNQFEKIALLALQLGFDSCYYVVKIVALVYTVIYAVYLLEFLKKFHTSSISQVKL